MKKGRFTKKELKFIKDNLDELSDIEIAAELTRSVKSIKSQRIKIEEEIANAKAEKQATQAKPQEENSVITEGNNAQLEILQMIKSGQITAEQGAELLKAMAPQAASKDDDELNRIPTFEEAWNEKEYEEYTKDVNENAMFIVDEDGNNVPTNNFLNFTKKRGPIKATFRNGKCAHKSVRQDGASIRCNICKEIIDAAYRQGMKGAANPNRKR